MKSTWKLSLICCSHQRLEIDAGFQYYVGISLPNNQFYQDPTVIVNGIMKTQRRM